MIDNKQ